MYYKGICRQGARNLKNILEGARYDLDCLIPTRLAGVARREHHKERGKPPVWHTSKGTLAGSLRTYLGELGWKEEEGREWTWIRRERQERTKPEKRQVKPKTQPKKKQEPYTETVAKIIRIDLKGEQEIGLIEHEIRES